MRTRKGSVFLPLTRQGIRHLKSYQSSVLSSSVPSVPSPQGGYHVCSFSFPGTLTLCRQSLALSERYTSLPLPGAGGASQTFRQRLVLRCHPIPAVVYRGHLVGAHRG